MYVRRLVGVVALAFTLALISCGGGSANSNPVPTPTPLPGDFQLVAGSAGVTGITLQQGGAPRFEIVQANPINGFKGTINLTLSGLPAGVIAPSGLPSITLAGSAQSVGVALAASQTTPLGAATVTVTGTSGAITHTVTFPLTITQAAPFAIQISPGSVSLTPASLATVQVSVTAAPGTSPQLAVSVSGAPSNSQVGVGSPQGFVTPSSPGSFSIVATVLAQPLQNFPLFVVASDNANNTSFVSLPLTVTVPFVSNTTPTRSTFFRTDSSPTGMVYDPLRKLVFVSVEILNEVLVLSAADGHKIASIPVSFPAGIDIAADGSVIYVASPFIGGVTVIDPDLLQVIGHSDVPSSVSGISQPVTFFQVAALSNGKVLFLPTLGLGGFSPFYLWDPTTDTFTKFGPQTLTSSVELMSRNADHSKVLAYGGSSQGALYDVTTDTFIGPSTVFNGPAISPDGSQIASGQFQTSPAMLAFYDSNLNQLASLPLGAFSSGGAATRLFYSLDGKRLYVVPDHGIATSFDKGVVAVIDTATFSVVGVIPAFSFGAASPFGGITTFALDETGMLFGAAFGGVGFLDLSTPTFLQETLPGNFIIQPSLASLSAPTQAQLNGVGFSSGLPLNLFFGAPPTSPQSVQASSLSVQSSNFVNVTIPPGTASGAANATLTRGDGFFEVMPDAVTFGPTILQIDANAGSTAGGNSIKIVGYGLSGPNTQVLIGGRLATVTQQSPAIVGQLFPTESITLNTPPGVAGKSDVTVTTPSGSVTVAGGFQYLNSVETHPILGLLDALVYDRVHQRLYITNQDHNRIEIFDLVAKTFLAPVSVGNGPTAMALTPDSGLLAILNRLDGTVSVLDTIRLTLTATYPLLTTADRDPVGCGGIPLNITPAAPHRILAEIECSAILFQGHFRLLDLDTGSLDCTGVAGCNLNGTDINFQNGLAALASSSDGTKILLATTTGGGTPLPAGVLDLTANTLTAGFTSDSHDAAISADGTIFAANFALLDSAAKLRGFTAIEPYADTGALSSHNVFGEKLNPAGSLLFYPQDSGVAIFDTHTGRLVRHIVLPVSIPQNSGAMALDESGTKMFLTTTTGIAIAQLDPAPLSIGTVNPAAGPSGTVIVLRGSGFQSGATVSFGTTQGSTTFVDSSTVQATVPTLPAGPVRISINNPDGSRYFVDDAFTLQ